MIAEYDQRGRILAGSHEEMLDECCRRWLADHLQGEDSVMIAAANADALELSRRARADLIRYDRIHDGPEVQLRHRAVDRAGSMPWLASAEVAYGGDLGTHGCCRLARESAGIPGGGPMPQFRFAMEEPYLATMTWERGDMPVPVQGEPAGRPTLAALRAMRGKILDAASRRGLDDIRVFGSVARDEAGATSDVDLLVAPGPGTTLFDLSGFALDVEEIVGRHVDVATPRGLKARIRDRVLAEAVAL